jgi:hypothetical protein
MQKKRIAELDGLNASNFTLDVMALTSKSVCINNEWITASTI